MNEPNGKAPENATTLTLAFTKSELTFVVLKTKLGGDGITFAVDPAKIPENSARKIFHYGLKQLLGDHVNKGGKDANLSAERATELLNEKANSIYDGTLDVRKPRDASQPSKESAETRGIMRFVNAQVRATMPGVKATEPAFTKAVTELRAKVIEAMASDKPTRIKKVVGDMIASIKAADEAEAKAAEAAKKLASLFEEITEDDSADDESGDE